MIKFRAWHKELKQMLYVLQIEWHGDTYTPCAIDLCNENYARLEQVDAELLELMQWTGLQDKNGLMEVYEGDIIDEYGNVAGNIYEDTHLHYPDSYWVVTAICCETWSDTYKELVKRGCHYAK